MKRFVKTLLLSLVIIIGFGASFLSRDVDITSKDSAILIANVMMKVQEETSTMNGEGKITSTISEPLIEEIVSLSEALKPHKIGSSEILSSIGRGQLLIALVKSDLDPKSYEKIYNFATFQYANLENANLENANLKGVFLSRSNLKNANLNKANLSGANLLKAHLEQANLSGADISRVNMKSANLSRAILTDANMESTYLVDAILDVPNSDLVENRTSAFLIK